MGTSLVLAKTVQFKVDPRNPSQTKIHNAPWVKGKQAEPVMVAARLVRLSVPMWEVRLEPLSVMAQLKWPKVEFAGLADC
ncbi:hypothetical protein OHJ21_21590 [Virgibacillus sp. LDC1]|uniref:hypothetical protein n=1 Tax=Paenibacillus sp. GM2FR TaxID=2059268 RepID=UPI001FAE8527|nr:hypothetical protein [Paenibacillus sp. GM2FR]MCV4233757.1 hypothetical protein [Virgibacillus sp. LDC1]